MRRMLTAPSSLAAFFCSLSSSLRLFICRGVHASTRVFLSRQLRLLPRCSRRSLPSQPRAFGFSRRFSRASHRRNRGSPASARPYRSFAVAASASRLRALAASAGRCRCFAFFKLAEVVAHGNGDLFQRLLADARNLLELLGRHVGQRLHGRDARSHQLLNDAFAQLAHLLDRRASARRPEPASAAPLPGASLPRS